MPNNTNQSHLSEEVQEIIGIIPSWIIRWGISVLALVFISLLIMAWFIYYPDSIEGQAKIISRNPPITIVAKKSGNIKIFRTGKQSVEQGEIVAMTESSVNLSELLYLNEMLRTGDDLKDDLFKNYDLGELQPALSKLRISYLNLADQLKFRPELEQISFLQDQIAALEEVRKNLSTQNQSFDKEFELRKSKFKTDSLLYTEMVIAKTDYVESKANFIQYERQGSLVERDILQNGLQSMSLRNEVRELRMDGHRKEKLLLEEYNISLNELLSQINQWEQNNLLRAPVAGTIEYFNFIEENQYVELGQNIFMILPNSNSYYAQVVIPIESSGKVKKGQSVNIRLSDFPSQEYGMLNGTVSDISLMPNNTLNEENAYSISIDLPKGLITSYGFHLSQRRFLTGQAQIVTEKRNLVLRIFQRVRDPIF